MRSGKFKFYFLIFVSTFCIASSNAQNGKGIALEGMFHYGKIIKHHDFLRYDVPASSKAFDLNLIFQTYGKKPWNELHNYPIFGITTLYYNFGDEEVLGDAISICPNLAIYLFRNKKFSVNGQIGAGPSYLTKPFDRLDNPNNNAIGSHINLNFYFRFNANWSIHPQWILNTGFSFTHYSNAAAAVPNYGINIPALTLGLKFKPKPINEEDFIEHGTSNKPENRFGVNLHTGVALKEIKSVGGPSYPIYSFTAAGMYYLSKTNRAMFGIEHERNKAAYAFGHHVYEFKSEKEAKRRSNRFMLFVADEFLFGHIGLMIQMGFYLTKDPLLAPYPFYNKWGFHYHFSKIGKTNYSLYIGTQIKTHIYIADYISIDMGVTF